jgi:hypothetical protein
MGMAVSENIAQLRWIKGLWLDGKASTKKEI